MLDTSLTGRGRRGRPPTWAWILAAATAAASSCGDSSEPTTHRGDDRPHVLLVTMDTTRADRLGCYGYDAAQTPTFDRMAERGVRFEQAYCTAPVTLPSHASILSGTYPRQHGVRDNGLFLLEDEAHLISEVLQDAGWQTGAFVSAYVIDESFGTGQGFDTFARPTLAREQGPPASEVPAKVTVDRAIAWLDEVNESSPWFLWLHLFDPHQPLEPPEPFRSACDDPYDAEIASADHELGRLLEAIAERFPGQPLVECLTADHGESNGEHDEPTHGVFVYDAVMRVPLILVPPDGLDAPRGSVDQRTVTNAAVAPTLLHVLGLDVTTSLPECRVAPLVDAEWKPSNDEAAILLESYTPFYSYRWCPIEALVDGRSKFIRTRRPELYDLSTDPGELRDLSETEAPRLEAMADQLAALQALHPPLMWWDTKAVRSDDQKQLEAMGYVAGSLAPPDFNRPDAKDLVNTRIQCDRARGFAEGVKMALARRDTENAEKLAAEAESILDQLEEVDPDGPGPLEVRARLSFYQGKKRRALPLFERLVTLNPYSPQYHYFLGECYRAKGEEAWAEAELAKTIRLEPNFQQAYEALGQLLTKQGRFGEAVWYGEAMLAKLADMGTTSATLSRALDAIRPRMQQAGQSPTPPPPRESMSMQPEGTR